MVLVEQPLDDHFRAFALLAERDGCAVYGAICRGVADDPEVLALLDEAPLQQRRPNLLLAAVHDLLLGGDEHPLGAHFDTVAAVRTIPFTPPASDVAVEFADFCRARSEPLRTLLASRSTQTNEVGRCSSLRPGLSHIAARYPAGTPLALLDLGTSAGLNLLFDDYHCTYRAAGGEETLEAGPARSAVRLECTARGDLHALPALEAPPIADRVGLDLSPIDPFSDDEARWLLACQWPENPTRFGRLRGALANVRTSGHPPRLVRGDLVDDLASVAATISARGPLVVFHSWVAAYLDEERQRALVDAVRALDSTERPVHHLYCESPVETPGLPTPASPMPRPGPDLPTALVHLGPAAAAPVRLADSHPHGYWLRWWPAAGRPD